MNVPSNFRRLKTDEILRRGDLYKDRQTGEVSEVRNIRYFGQKVRDRSNFSGYSYTFYRERAKSNVRFKPYRKNGDSGRFTKVRDIAKPAPKIPIVTFFYPHAGDILCRTVHVISFDGNYLTGLEYVVGLDLKPRYQFKKFLKNRIRGNVRLISFKPKA